MSLSDLLYGTDMDTGLLSPTVPTKVRNIFTEPFELCLFRYCAIEMLCFIIITYELVRGISRHRAIEMLCIIIIIIIY